MRILISCRSTGIAPPFTHRAVGAVSVADGCNTAEDGHITHFREPETHPARTSEEGDESSIG